MKGWECPGCGRCYGPFVQQCSCCGMPEFTTGNTTEFPCQHQWVTDTGGTRCMKCGRKA